MQQRKKRGQIMNIFTDSIRREREYAELIRTLTRELYARPLPVLVNGLSQGASDAFFLSSVEDLGKAGFGTSLVISADEKDCVRLCSLFERFGYRAAFFVGRDLTFHNIISSHEYEYERVKVLTGLVSGNYDVVVTTPDAALSYTLPREVLIANTLSIDFDTLIDTDAFAKNLVASGYTRVDMVDGAGQFCVRGGIIDVYPPHANITDSDGKTHSGAFALRIELFGDEIDRMGLFDVESQRIHTSIRDIKIPPAREILIDPMARARMISAIEAQFRATKKESACVTLAEEKAVLDASDDSRSLDVNFADKYISLIYPEKTCILDYFGALGKRVPVYIKGTSAVYDRLKANEWQSNQLIEELMEGGTINGKYAEYQKSAAAFDTFLDAQQTVHVDSMSYGLSGKKLGGIFGFRAKHMVSYAENLNLLLEDLESYTRGGYFTVVVAENEAAAKNLFSMLREKGFRVVIESPSIEDSVGAVRALGGRVYIKWKHYVSGYELVSTKLAVLSTSPDARNMAISPLKSTKSKRKKHGATEAILSYAELEVGDYVVHEAYGIGRYTGIENLTTGGISRDYIGIQYAGSDKLYLPVEKMDVISKYIGAHADDGTLKLSKFGGEAWNKTKSRARAAVKDMAKDLIKLYAERAREEGFAFPEDDDFQRDFEVAFEYDETEAQLEAAEEIKKDMMRPVPMDRLLCGDVGFGKTEVALRGAYKAVLGGKQVAVLVPTTILAMQHYQTFLSRMRAFGVNVDMLSRFRTNKEQELTLRKLRRGEIDIIIGTHRIISKDIEFKDLGLVIVDEEQRFGVAQKEKLKQISKNVDVLTLTATPIPRTLNMAMGGIRDISILDEAPVDRLPVQTYVLEHDDTIIIEAIKKELRRGGQVFYLHNFVETIYSVTANLSRELPDAKIRYAHGKMEREELEEIWRDMLAGEIDILVCTTIIETGVDVSNANTLIVDNAHRMGLSQLHQLRGRVGRSSRRAYAYFTYPPYRALSEIAEKRLEAIRDYAEFGAGFKIALRDLEIRGAGNILGAQQHGHLDAIGYELYIKLLNEAVLEEKGELPPPKIDCTVTVDFDAFIPEKYVKYPAQRMALYKKIAMIENELDESDIADELMDRYGEMPYQVENLLRIALIRAYAIKCRVKTVKQNGGEVEIYPSEFDFEVLSDLSDAFDGRIKMALTSDPHVKLRLVKGESGLVKLRKVFEKYAELSASARGAQ